VAEVITRLSQIGANTKDEDNIRLRKSLLVLLAFLFMLAGVAWGLMYFWLGETTAGIIPFTYGIFSLLSVTYFGLTGRYHFFRFSQLILILLLPFFLMVALGGFVSGSAVIVWSFICPMGAMMFDEHQRAPRWFIAWAALVILSGFLQPFVSAANNLSLTSITFFFVINLLGVGFLIFLMVYYFVGQKNVFQERSENLLLNILPKEIVDILKDEPRTIADNFEGASILFADVVDFTPMSASMTPTELVELLNEVFSYFDTLTEEYELEKIKTIGDCYMVASGVPRPRPDHAQVLTHMALRMQEYVNNQVICGHRLSFRIGLNSGPVVAGVIGRKKFIYDLWGDAVNTASRMESHGSEGQIQITRNTYELIKDDFVCEAQGTVNVKGKGEMDVWYVTGAR
jgi:adenylate cyclase